MLASGVLSSGNVANAFLSESAGNCFSSALTNGVCIMNDPSECGLLFTHECMPMDSDCGKKRTDTYSY